MYIVLDQRDVCVARVINNNTILVFQRWWVNPAPSFSSITTGNNKATKVHENAV